MKDGEAWHTTDAEVASALERESKSRVEVDPWQDTIAQFSEHLIGESDDGTLPSSALFGMLKIDYCRQDKAAQTRLGRLMKNLGFERIRSPKTGTRYRKKNTGSTPPDHLNHQFLEEGER